MSPGVMRFAIKFCFGGIAVCLIGMLGAWAFIPAAFLHDIISIFAASIGCWTIGIVGNWLALRAFDSALEKTADEARAARRQAWIDSLKP